MALVLGGVFALMKIDVRHNFPQIAKQIKELSDDLRDKVMARTINKVASGAQGQMARAISAEFRVSNADARANLKIVRASFKAGRLNLTGQLLSPSRAKGRGFNLIRFVEKKVSFREAGKRKARGELRDVFVQIKRNGGKKRLRGAFIATNKKTGGTAVFIRAGQSRYPLKTMTTIDIPQMFNARKIKEPLIKYIEERLPIVFAQEFNFAKRSS